MSGVHLHLLRNHVPVVGSILGIALLGYALIRRNSEISKLSLALFAVLAAVAIAVFLTGEPAEELVEKLPGFSASITERHEELARLTTIALVGFGTMGLIALAYYRRRLLPRWVAATSFAISLTIGGLLVTTANLGGQIRHSEIRSGVTVLGDRESESEERHR
jgi:hypothetical protein